MAKRNLSNPLCLAPREAGAPAFTYSSVAAHNTYSHQVNAEENKAALKADSSDVLKDDLADWRSHVGDHVQLAAPYLSACDTDDTIAEPPPGHGMFVVF
jgi:hypothetical protein